MKCEHVDACRARVEGRPALKNASDEAKVLFATKIRFFHLFQTPPIVPHVDKCVMSEACSRARAAMEYLCIERLLKDAVKIELRYLCAAL